MKPRAGSLKRKTKLTYLQLDTLRKTRAQTNKVRNKRQKITVDEQRYKELQENTANYTPKTGQPRGKRYILRIILLSETEM